ncbi:MAG: type II toxin-antitoxin system HipA family toxin [Aphanocapsa sp. GSE-SYN-MK-11-07L]|jgi:serine/threonine-protein kinase HipA|nr:type II toxin-antitoxin system HipA family toxin [Aphanocapsa sp. GSE-SYN-MK-11-07L]
MGSGVVRAKQVAKLNVLMNGRLVALLSKLPSGAMTFQYADEWLTTLGARPVSLSLPLRHTAYEGEKVYNFFDNLLPDYEQIRARIQARFQVPSRQPFDLLSAIGADCVGAIQLYQQNTLKNLKNIEDITAQPLTSAEIAKLLKGYAVSPLGMTEEVDDFRISIAGAQEKTALLWHQEQWCRPIGTTPTSHIFKLPIGLIANNNIDLRDSCENEWLCLEIAKAFRLPTANAQIQQFEDVKVLIVERFDRRWSSNGQWLMRLPQEDMCQALGVPPGLKYESEGGPGMAQIMHLLLGASNADADREQFFRSQVLFWLLAATDGHAKNFSIYLEPNGNYRLTPLYDVMSIYPLMDTHAISRQKAKLAMAWQGKKPRYLWTMVQARHCLSMAKAIGFSQKRAEQILREMLAQVSSVAGQIASSLPARFPTHISEPILKGMVSLAQQQLSQIEQGLI